MNSSQILGSMLERNSNQVADNNPDKVLDIYEEEINEEISFPEYITNVEKGYQDLTDKKNNCSIENEVYALAMVQLSRDRKEEEMDLEPTYERKVESISEMLENNDKWNQNRAVEIGCEIDDVYGPEFNSEPGNLEEGEEMEDGAVVF